MKRTVLAVVLLSAFALGCSGDEPTQPPAPNPGPPTIAITPSSSTVLVRATQNLLATPSETADTAVTWRLIRDPALADTTNVGTIVSTGKFTATYTAPTTVESAGFDYTVGVQAVSTRDSTVYGLAQVTVPRVRVTVTPGHVFSVPPGTIVPFQVLVANAPTPGFTLYVEGIPGGDAGVGTWDQAGPAAAEYTAPVHDTLAIYGLIARPVEDPRRFATANVTVRAGFPMPAADLSRDQFAPEWDPTGRRLAYVRGGSSWQLVVYDFVGKTEDVLATIEWGGLTYDGRVAWSDDGSILIFSEKEAGGRGKIGVVSSNGSGRATFAPEALTSYDEACFIPTPAAESIYVAQHKNFNWELRAYRLAALPGEAGRAIYTPPLNVEVHSPDAILLPPALRPYVGFETVVNGDGTVRSTKDDDTGPVGVAYSSATARTRQVRWAIPPSDGVPWLTFVHEETHNVYRVQRSGLDLPQRCYVDYFPESACDLNAQPLMSFEFENPQAVARLEPSGHSRIWIIGFPRSDVVPVTRTLETELRRVGAWKAMSPAEWRRWRVAS